MFAELVNVQKIYKKTLWNLNNKVNTHIKMGNRLRNVSEDIYTQHRYITKIVSNATDLWEM